MTEHNTPHILDIPAAIRAADADSRIVEIAVYPDGWVPGAYRWPAPGRRYIYRRDASGAWAHRCTEPIDRKRPHGEGPSWVAMSESRGRLASG